MELTKLAQSTILIEVDEGRILIDPGVYNYQEGRMSREDHGRIEYLIITHKHDDHFDREAVRAICRSSKPSIFCTSDTAAALADVGVECKIVGAGDTINADSLTFSFVPIDHVFKGQKVDGFGVVIRYKDIRIYHTSDTFYMETKPEADILFVPINNRGVCMGIDDAVRFTLEVKPRIVIPFHYDSPKDVGKVNPVDFKNGMTDSKSEIAVKILSFGESFIL